MKIKHFFFTLAASLAVFAGCQQKPTAEDLDPMVELDQKELVFTQAAGSQALTFFSSRNWIVRGLPDWVVAEPEKGPSSLEKQTVTISVLENTGNNRECQIYIQGGIAKGYITVKQPGPGGEIVPGDGSKEHPFSATEARAKAAELASGVESDKAYYIHGFVKNFNSSKHEEGIKNFGNALFYITDDNTLTGDDFYCYQVYYLGGKKFTSTDQIKVGDEVIVYGKITNYNGTYETVGKGAAYIYSLNGKTEGGDEPDPAKVVDATVSQVIAEQKTDVIYRLSGTVSGFNSQYCSFDITDATGKIYVYSVTAETKKEYAGKLRNGDTVTIEGEYLYYSQKSQHEIVNAKITAWTSGGDTPPTPGTIVDVTVAEFIAAPVSTSQNYRLKGTVKGPINTQYGNFDIEDATGKVYVYGTSNFSQYASKFAEGGTVTFVGQRGDFNGKVEVLNGYIEKYEAGGDTPPTPPGPGPDTQGDGTLQNPYTAADANALGATLSSGDNTTLKDKYVTGIISEIKNIDTGQYGNSEYYISVDGTTANQFYIYRGYSLGGNKFKSSSEIKVGDKVVVFGTIINYMGNTVEMTTGSKIVSLNGESGGDTPDSDEPISGTNLIDNGGFELWTGDKPDGWDFEKGNASLSKNADAKEGVNSCEVGGDSAGKENKRLMSKQYSLKPGTYQILAYIKGEGQYRVGYAKLTNGQVANSNDYIYIDAAPVQASSDWKQHIAQFTIKEQTDISVVVMNSKKGNGKTFLIDDIKLVTDNGGLQE